MPRHRANSRQSLWRSRCRQENSQNEEVGKERQQKRRHVQFLWRLRPHNVFRRRIASGIKRKQKESLSLCQYEEGCPRPRPNPRNRRTNPKHPKPNTRRSNNLRHDNNLGCTRRIQKVSHLRQFGRPGEPYCLEPRAKGDRRHA